MDDNNRNFILAIVLSMAVLFAWQYFFVPSKPPEEAGKQTAQQEQQQQQPSQATPGPQAPGAQVERPCPRRRRAARAKRPASVDDVARRSDRGLTPRPHRHAEHQRLDQSQGRAHRRCRAQEISGDGRADEPQCRAAVAVGRARRLLQRAGLGRRAPTARSMSPDPIRCGKRLRARPSRRNRRSPSLTTTARG